MVFTTEAPEDGGVLPVAEGGEGTQPPSSDDELTLNKLISE